MCIAGLCNQLQWLLFLCLNKEKQSQFFKEAGHMFFITCIGRLTLLYPMSECIYMCSLKHILLCSKILSEMWCMLKKNVLSVTVINSCRLKKKTWLISYKLFQNVDVFLSWFLLRFEMWNFFQSVLSMCIWQKRGHVLCRIMSLAGSFRVSVKFTRWSAKGKTNVNQQLV